MRLGRWFLPKSPDVIGLLRSQAAVTLEGMEALVSWAGGDDAARVVVHECEERADVGKRDLAQALTVAFTTPFEPEDIYELSVGLDRILDAAKNTVREAEVMHTAPDRAIQEMAVVLARGTSHLGEALAALASGSTSDARTAADAARTSRRDVEHVYRAAMSALVEAEDVRAVAARRELYRRLARTSDGIAEVADRVWYAILKGI